MAPNDSLTVGCWSGDTIGTLPSSLRTQDMVEAATKAFEILEPWFKAKPSDEAHGFEEIQHLINGIKVQGRGFFKAIEHSLETSQYGVDLARDMDVLWRNMVSGEDAHQILQYIERIKRDVKGAHDSAEESLRRFDLVRKGITELSISISPIANLLLARMIKVKQSEDRHHVAARFAKHTATFLSKATDFAAASPSPIIMIVVPMILPILELIMSKYGEYEFRKVEKRKQEGITLDQVAVRLEGALLDLDKLRECLKPFTTWWSGIEMELEYIAKRIDAPDFDLNQAALAAKQRVTEVSKLYGDYQFEMRKLKDHNLYPSDAIEEGPSQTLVYNFDGKSILPAQAVSLLCEELVAWEASFQELRHSFQVIGGSAPANLTYKLDEIQKAMSSEFSIHVVLLRQLAVQARECSISSPGTQTSNHNFSIKEAANLSLDAHTSTSKLVTFHFDSIRPVLKRRATKTLKGYRNKYNAQEEGTPRSGHAFVQGYIGTFSDWPRFLGRFEQCGNNVGSLCSIIALGEMDRATVDSHCLDAVLIAVSHLTIR